MEKKLVWEKVTDLKDTTLPIRISTTVKEQLKLKAQEENRTVSNLIEKLIKDYLNKRGDKK